MRSGYIILNDSQLADLENVVADLMSVGFTVTAIGAITGKIDGQFLQQNAERVIAHISSIGLQLIEQDMVSWLPENSD